MVIRIRERLPTVSAKAVRTAAFFTNSLIPIDVPGLSISLTLRKTADVLCFVTLIGAAISSLGDYLDFSLLRGTIRIERIYVQPAEADTFNPVILLALDRDVPAGTHTYKLQMAVSGGTGYIEQPSAISAIAFHR